MLCLGNLTEACSQELAEIHSGSPGHSCRGVGSGKRPLRAGQAQAPWKLEPAGKDPWRPQAAGHVLSSWDAKSDKAQQHLCTQVLSNQALQLGFQNLSCFGGIYLSC